MSEEALVNSKARSKSNSQVASDMIYVYIYIHIYIYIYIRWHMQADLGDEALVRTKAKPNTSSLAAPGPAVVTGNMQTILGSTSSSAYLVDARLISICHLELLVKERYTDRLSLVKHKAYNLKLRTARRQKLNLHDAEMLNNCFLHVRRASGQTARA
jgi:hypothetical protein